MTRHFMTACGLALALLVGWSVAPTAQIIGPTVGTYQLVSSTRVTLTQYDYTYRATLTNPGGALLSATATVSSNTANTIVTDNSLTFGPVPAGASAVSTDTFTIRQNRLVPFNPASLTWQITPVEIGRAHV